MKKLMLVVSLMLLFSVSLSGCPDKGKEDEKKTETKKEESKYSGMAGDELWKEAMSTKDLAAFDAYLSQYPKGEHADKAKEILMDNWDKKVEELNVDEMKDLTAVIETNQGTIKFKFFPEVAPKHVRNFIKLAQSHFYDGTIFHRVIEGFMIQGGDPTGTGMGGPGYKIEAEFNDKPHLEGTVSMARASSPDTAGSQFFICLEPQPRLDNQYTVFGQVTDGMDVVHKIGSTSTDPRDKPKKDMVMEKVYIEGL